MERVTPKPSSLDRTHLRRETRIALELAVVALAPPTLVDRLASAAGLLEALEELRPDTPPVRELAQSILVRGKEALGAWQDWLGSRSPRAA